LIDFKSTELLKQKTEVNVNFKVKGNKMKESWQDKIKDIIESDLEEEYCEQDQEYLNLYTGEIEIITE